MLKFIMLFLIWLMLGTISGELRSIAHDVHVLASPPAGAR